MSDIGGFPEDDLPSPMSQRRRVAASDRSGQIPPPPRVAARLTPVPTPSDDQAALREADPERGPERREQNERADEQEARTHESPADAGGDTATSGAAGGRSKRRTKQTDAPPAPVPASVTGYADINVQLPRSLAEALEQDARSRPMVFRDAFEAHVEDVVANAPRRPAPKVLGMERPRERRRADPNDPFVEVLFRMRPNEKAVWLEWVAKTDLSRSAFATEMLRREYDARATLD